VELGVVPVAANKLLVPSSLLTAQQVEGIEDVSAGTQVTEHLLALNLDLVMGGAPSPFVAASPQLNEELYWEANWKQRFFAVARLLGREAEASALMRHYEYHAGEVRRQMAGRTLRIAVMIPEPDAFSLVADDSFPWSVLQEAGVSCCPSRPNRHWTWYRQLSWEALKDADGDALFVLPYWYDRTQAGFRDPREQLAEQPLWPTLRVVQQGHVYFVHDYWKDGGPVAADHILSDVEKYALAE
jgi:ABC-type Fe3+-hydroxamate transport system substrate-binding protein